MLFCHALSYVYVRNPQIQLESSNPLRKSWNERCYFSTSISSPPLHFSTKLYGQSRYRFIGLCQQGIPQETIVIKIYRCWKHLFTFPEISLAQLWLANLSTMERLGVRCVVEPAGLSHNPSVWWLHQSVSFSINTRVSQRYELMMMKGRWQP